MTEHVNRTDFDSLGPGGQRRRLIYDPTINAGHLLTFAALVIAGFVAFNSLDKRVVALERDSAHQSERDNVQDTAIREKFEDIKGSLHDVQQAVNDIRRAQLAAATK